MGLANESKNDNFPHGGDFQSAPSGQQGSSISPHPRMNDGIRPFIQAIQLSVLLWPSLPDTFANGHPIKRLTIIRPTNSPAGGSGKCPDPPAAEFAGDVRRWARRRTLVLQTPTNKADPVKSAAPKGQKNEKKDKPAYVQAR